jgi:hypothetical protein
VGGDKSSKDVVMLIGDSHAGQWRPVLEDIARQRHLKVYVREHDGCPPFPVRQVVEGKDKATVCQRQEEGDLRLVSYLKPKAVILASWLGEASHVAHDDLSQATPDEQMALWQAAIERRIGDIQKRGAKVGTILDEPTIPIDASKCLARTNRLDQCTVTRAAAMAISGKAIGAERAALKNVRGVPVLDMPAIVCDATKCNLEIGGHLVYVDTHHITDAFAAVQEPELARIVDKLR